MNETNVVTLRTGERMPEPLVKVTMLSLSELMKSDPITFYEFVEVCRDPEHELWGDSEEKLKRLHLLESHGQPHQAIKEITLAATEGDGLELEMRSPVDRT